MAGKKPNTNITTEQLLNTQSLAAYLQLKLDQLGASCNETAAATGKKKTACTTISTYMKPDNTKAFRADRLALLADFFAHKHTELGLPAFSAREREHLESLNNQLTPLNPYHRGETEPPDPSITPEQLLQTTTVQDFIVLKRQQLGMATLVFDGLLNTKRAFNHLRSSRRTIQYQPEVFERLVAAFKEMAATIEGVGPMSQAEEDHLRAIHSAMKPPAALKEKKGYIIESGAFPDNQYEPWMAMPNYNTRRENEHVLPDGEMLEALFTGDHATWKKLKDKVLSQTKHAGKRIFLGNCPKALLCDFNGFDLSNCDLTSFPWPRDASKVRDIASLKNAVLIPETATQWAYIALHPSLTRAYERDNPGAECGRPMPTRRVSQANATHIRRGPSTEIGIT